MGTIGSQRLTLKSRQHRQSLSHVSCCDCGLSSLASQSTGWIGLWFLCPEHWPGQRTQSWDQTQGRSWCGLEAQSPSDTAIYGEAWDCIKEGNHSELLSFFYLLLWGRLLWTSAETSSGLWGKRLFCYHGALELQIKKEKWHIMEAYLPSFQLHSSFWGKGKWLKWQL